MTASAVFILDVKGKVIISRNYRGDVPMNCVERFSGHVLEADEGEGIFRVHSALSLYRQRAIDRAYEWIPARRIDLIRFGDNGECRLVRRTVILAETILQTPNLAIFL